VSLYRDVYQASLDDPAGFWREAAREVSWTRAPQQILDASRPPFYRWFPDAELNTCANALDRHVDAGRGEQQALIYDSPVTGTKRSYTYTELLEITSRFAGVLCGLGVSKGDRVVIYMPMIPEAVVAMLACARIGAVHSVVFGGFAPHELAARIDDARPKVIISASCGIEPSRIVEYKPMLDAAIEASAHPPRHCVIVQRDQQRCDLVDGRDFDWDDLVAAASPAPPVPVAATDPLYILYTSGTTGKPKGIVRDNGGHAVALMWSMRHIYGIDPGDTFWAASDVGWVVGHSYIVYGPLLVGATTVLYEGKPVGTPDPGAFWRVIAEHRVKVLFTAPTAIRAIRKEDPDGVALGGHDLACLESLFFAGERLDPDTYHWATEKLGVPVIDHWWQTETGWAIAANPMGIEPLPIKPGSPCVPMPGYRVAILHPDGSGCEPGEEGAICLSPPLPPGRSIHADDRAIGSGRVNDVRQHGRPEILAALDTKADFPLDRRGCEALIRRQRAGLGRVLADAKPGQRRCRQRSRHPGCPRFRHCLATAEQQCRDDKRARTPGRHCAPPSESSLTCTYGRYCDFGSILASATW